MPTDRGGADRVGHGEADLGHAQADNPPDDPDMLTDTSAFDADTDYHGEAPEPPEERGNEDPAPNMP